MLIKLMIVVTLVGCGAEQRHENKQEQRIAKLERQAETDKDRLTRLETIAELMDTLMESYAPMDVVQRNLDAIEAKSASDYQQVLASITDLRLATEVSIDGLRQEFDDLVAADSELADRVTRIEEQTEELYKVLTRMQGDIQALQDATKCKIIGFETYLVASKAGRHLRTIHLSIPQVQCVE